MSTNVEQQLIQNALEDVKKTLKTTINNDPF
jgi:hypothetical protein